MEIESIAEQINEQINLWSKEKDKLVVGIDGYSGIGKTIISNELATINKEVELLHMDDYATTANTKEKLEPQLNKNTGTFKMEWRDATEGGLSSLEQQIKSFRTDENSDKKVLLVEGIFFFHPDVLSDCFDKIIFLNGNEKEADERRVKREKERWGDKYFPETHPDSFTRLFKLAWAKYKELYKPIEKADFVVSV